jgi:hypothetical protein
MKRMNYWRLSLPVAVGTIQAGGAIPETARGYADALVNREREEKRVLRCFRWVTGGVRSLLAERGIEGSRGLQPTAVAGRSVRRGATIEEPSRFYAPFKRRSATQLASLAHRGLKLHGYRHPVAPRPQRH